MRSIQRILGAVLVGCAAALSGSLPALAQEVPSAEAIERMARVFTELDPEIKAVEMHSYVPLCCTGHAQAYTAFRPRRGSSPAVHARSLGEL